LLPERHSLSWLRSCAVSRAPSSSSLYLPFRTSSVGFAANIRGIIFIIQESLLERDQQAGLAYLSAQYGTPCSGRADSASAPDCRRVSCLPCPRTAPHD
jgi:hypothetical protein